MPNVGPLEILVVAIIALVVLGPKRLPDFGRSVGRGLREFRDALSGDEREAEQDDRDLDAGERDQR
jgi:sec-independent protein translocase protein TatA